MNDKMISENTANNVSAELSARRSGGDNMRHVAKHKRINAAAVVLTVIIVVLVCALAVSLVIIDKLHKNNLFSKNILLSNNYFLSAYPDYGEGTAAGGDVDEAMKKFHEALMKASNNVASYLYEGGAFPEELRRVSKEWYGCAGDPVDEKYGYYDGAQYDDKSQGEGDYAQDEAAYWGGGGDNPLSNERRSFFGGIYDQFCMNLEYYVDSANAMYGEYGATEKADGKICEYIFEDCFIEVKVNSEEKKMIEVPYFSQEGILPNGCEATSAAMLLNFYGVKVSPEEFVDNYLDCESVAIRWGCRYGPNPKNAYAGDPRSKDKGWGCFSPVIVRALNKALPKGYYAKNVTGMSFNDLKKRYIDRGIPVCIWGTVYMEEIDRLLQWQSEDGKETFLYPANEHCMVFVGYDREKYYFADPYGSAGVAGYPINDCVLAYNSLGSQAVVIMQKKK